MSDITITYKGAEIASLSDTGTKTLLTSGKYCEDDITIDYTAPGGGSVQTASVSISNNDADVIYYTDATMTVNSVSSGSRDLSGEQLPVGSLLVCVRTGAAQPMPFPMTVSGITLLDSYSVGSRGQARVYEVTG